jgi:hypothetical protein
MSYPTLEQYNEALQHPSLALVDPVLKAGTIATTGLGLPLALCGGFALTYTISTAGKKYAVRCFHKQSNRLEERYSAISKRLKSLSSPYFLDFEFQQQGVRVNGAGFPVVKMAWASGDTLATFVEANLRNKIALQRLGSSLSDVSTFLKQSNIAHGDIQPENVMVANDGQTVQLIDYDGVYVDDLKSLGSAELGQRNFQHPGRSTVNWDSSLDRFSFISLNLSLRILHSEPELWAKTQSDQSAILFRANDYAAPGQSVLFQGLFGKPQFAEDAKNFAAICTAPLSETPTLKDFLSRTNIPKVVVNVSPTVRSVPLKYASAYPVLDARNYALCSHQVGNLVELIGCIVEVRRDTTRRGKPYVFINFGHWKGNIVKISIWSEGLAKLKDTPTDSWVGRWIAVIGLMDPPYQNRRYGYSHLSISITQANQMHVLTEAEAKFRLSGVTGANGSVDGRNNKAVLEGIRGGNARPSNRNSPSSRTPNPIPISSNQAILQAMKESSSASTPGGRMPPPQGHGGAAQQKGAGGLCFVATAAFGDSDHPDVVFLRRFRDETLSRRKMGRGFIATYARFGPGLAKLVMKWQPLRRVSRSVIAALVAGLRNRLNY